MANITERIHSIVDFDYSQVSAGAPQVASQFRDIEAAGKGTGSAAEGLREVGNAGEDAGEGIRHASDAAREQQQGFDALLGTARLLAQGYFALRTAAESYQTAREGAVSLELQQAFADQLALTGQSLDDFLGKLDAAASGTIDATSLIQSSSRAMLLGVGGDAETLGSLLEVARFRARLLGTETSEAFSDIVTGIGRASPLILDNLGIIIDSEQVYGEYAASIGKTADELTKMEQTQALTTAVVEEGQRQISEAGGINDSAADSFRRLEAQLDNTKDSWAQLFAVVSVPLVSGATWLLGVVEAAGQTQRQLSVVSAAATNAGYVIANNYGNVVDGLAVTTKVFAGDLEGARQIMAKYPGALEAFESAARNTAEAQGFMGQQVQDSSREMAIAAGESDALGRALATAAGDAAFFASETSKANQELSNFIGFASQATGIDLSALSGDLEEQARKAKEILDETLERRQEQVGGVDFGLLRHTQETQDELRQLGKEGADRRAQDEINAAEKARQEQTRLTQQQADEATRVWEQHWDDRRQMAQSALGEIESAVSGALDLSFQVSPGDDLLDKFLPGARTIGPNEIVRRLQDVVNQGSQSPWADFYAQLLGIGDDTVEGEVKARAEKLIRDITTGLRPDLIDVESVVNVARQRIIGRRNLEAVQQQATQQLVQEGFLESEINFALDQDKVRSNLVDSIISNEQAQLEARRGDVEALADGFVGILNERIKGKIGEIDAIDLLLENFAERLMNATEEQGTGGP